MIRKYKIIREEVIRKAVKIPEAPLISLEDSDISLYGITGEKAITFIGGGYNFIIKEATFTLDTYGSNSAEITLSKNVDIEIPAGTYISISVKNKPLYLGYVYESYDINNQDEIQLKCKGLIEKFKDVGITKNYASGTKVKDIIKDICTQIAIEYPILKVKDDNFNVSNNYAIPVPLNIDKKNAFKMIEALINSINCYLYIDGLGNIILKEKNSGIDGIIFSEKQLVELKLDMDNIYNHIYVKRQSPQGTGETGWTIPAGFPLSDQASIKAYGIKQKDIFVPEFFDDATCLAIGNNFLNEYKRPKYKGEATKVPLNKIYNIGNYKIVSLYNELFEVATEFDNLSSLIYNTNDTTATETITNTDYISGSGSLQIQLTAPSQKKYYVDLGKEYFINSFFIYAKLEDLLNQKRNFKFKIIYGLNSPDENEIQTTINSYRFSLYRIQIPITLVRFVGIKLNDNKLNMRIFFDKLYFKYLGWKHFNMFCKKIKYKLSNGENYCDLTFEREEARIENFIKGIINEGELIKILLERR